jgi:hypothetical protein
MTIKEAILKSLEDLKTPVSYKVVYDHILKNKYYFSSGKTFKDTVSSRLGEFISTGDLRIKRIKNSENVYLYYLSKMEEEIDLSKIQTKTEEKEEFYKDKKTYKERDLHKLLATFLRNKNILSKTIFHEESNAKVENQKWIHPDMVGVEFFDFKNETTLNFSKILEIEYLLKIFSFEIKKEINNDYELKKSFFQTVSNSSWANYGYLVAFEINSNLYNEMERLSQSFGIGFIKLEYNLYESKILFPATYKKIDFKTVDKLCSANSDFKIFIEKIENIISADTKYLKSSKDDLEKFSDEVFDSNLDSEIIKYYSEKNFPISEEDILENENI